MDREPASLQNRGIRCPECLHSLPKHAYQCSIYQQARRKLIKAGLLGGAATVGAFLLGHAQAVPAPSIGSTVEQGSMESVASFIVYKDGSTFLARDGATGANVYLSTNAQTVIQNAIDALPSSGGRVFLKNGTYPVTGLTPKNQLVLDGESWGAILQATGNNQKIITVNNTGIARTLIENLSFDTGGFTGCTAIDYNITNDQSLINVLRKIHTTGNFTTCIDWTGQEDGYIDDFLSEGQGDIIVRVNGGQTDLNHIIMGNSGEGSLKFMAQQLLIQNSILNQCIHTQQGNALASLDITFKNCYMANPINSTGKHKFQQPDFGGGSGVIRCLTLENCYIGCKNDNAFFANTGAATSFDIWKLIVKNCQFQNLDASTIKWLSNGSTGRINIGCGTGNFPPSGLSPTSLEWEGNIVIGIITDAVLMDNGLGLKGVFKPPPRGFGITTPGFPVTNVEQQNGFGRRIRITILGLGGATMTGYNIRDAYGTQNGYATTAIVAGYTFELDPYAKVSFTYTGGTPSWQWYET